MTTAKQRELLEKYAEKIAVYRTLQAKADALMESITDYESAEAAHYANVRAGDALNDLEFLVQQEYCAVPYRRTREKAVYAFMHLVLGEGK